MRASVLFVCVLVAAALACPLKKHEEEKCSCTPKIVPLQWKVKTFPDQYATIAFQGPWYLNMATPTCISDETALKTGFFYNVFPSICNRAVFYDNTPENSLDFNINYIMLDSSFNLLTQSMDYSQSVVTPAYANSNLALFNIGTQQTYKSPIKTINPFTDEELIKYQVDDYYQRYYTVAIVGSDSKWQEYMVFVILNEYENLFTGHEEHIIWVLTRNRTVDSATYQRAFNDIKASGMNPNHLISVDQSIDLTKVPTLTEEDIKGKVFKRTTTKTEESTSSTNGGVVMSSKKTTVEETTNIVSTVEYTLNPTFSIPYDYDAFEWSNGIKVLKGLTLEQYASALNGKFYLSLATPLRSDDNAKSGLLNTAFPCSNLQVVIESTDSWKYGEQYMMVERCYDATTGELIVRRNLLQIACSDDGSMPFASVVLYSEAYGEQSLVEVTPFSYDKITLKTTNLLYKQKVVMGITAFQPNKYVMMYMYNQIPNQMYQNNPVRPFYVFTKEPNMSKSDADTINQEILRSGYLTRNLVKMDQTKPIDDDYKFEKTFFFPDSPSTPSGKPKYPFGLGPVTSPNPNSLSPDYCPSIIPSSWKVKQFENQEATIAFQGTWNLQIATPTKMRGLNPMKIGLFADFFPCAKPRTIFLDTTPTDDFDFNMNYYWLDTTFNLITQQIETIQGLFKAAYPWTRLAVFNVCVPQYYSQPITELSPNDDINEVKYKLNEIYKREFTVAVIGAVWDDYMVFAVVNKYDNMFNGPNDHLIWVFTRSENPSYETYKRAYDDIKASGMSPYGLMSVDQSIDLTTIPTVSEADINGIVKTGTIKTTEETKETCTSTDGISSRSTSSSTTKTTYESSLVNSPYNIVVRPNYVSPYELDYSKYSDKIKAIKNMLPKDQRQALSGKYYVNMAGPMTCEENGKPGIFYTMFPAASLSVQFEDYDNSEWNTNTQYMMMDVGLDVVSGKVHKTRTVIRSAFDESYQYSTFMFYSEGYYTNALPEIKPFDYGSIVCETPGQLYRDKYMASVVAYKPNSFVALYVHNQLKNLANGDYKNQMVILTRNRLVTKDEIDEITQSITLTGYNVSDLIFVDQTKVIDEEIKLDSSYFQIITETSSSSSSSSSSSIQSSTVSMIEESSSSSSKVEIISN